MVVARVGGELRDLTYVLRAPTRSRASTVSSPDGLAVLRHSTAHVLAQAVQNLFPGTRLGIGPPIENGFYYDFDVERPFTPEDLVALEKRMSEIIKEGQRFSRRASHGRRGTCRAGVRALQARAHRAQGWRVSEEESTEVGGRADDLRQPRPTTGRAGLGRPVPWTAPTHDPADPRQRREARAHRRGLLAGQREEPAAAADLRDGLARQGRAARLRASGSRRPRGATTASSATSSTSSPSRTSSAPASRSSTPRVA